MYYENFPVLWDNIYQNIRKSGIIIGNVELLKYFCILEIKDKTVIIFSNFHKIADYFTSTEILCIDNIIKDNLTVYNIVDVEYQDNYVKEIVLDYSKTLDSFIVSTENRLALAVAREIINNIQKQPYSPLYLYGKTGLGKTHLINGIVIDYKKKYQDNKIIYYSGETFLSSFFEATKNNNLNNWKNYHHECNLFIMEDIQFLENCSNAINELYSILNCLYTAQNKPQIIITCNKEPDDLIDFSDSFKSRLQWGVKIEILSPTKITKKDIIKALCKKHDITINDELIAYIAKNSHDNIRKLEGLIKTILSHVVLLGENIDQTLIDKITRKDIIYQKRNNIHSISEKDILNNVCTYFNINEKDIISKNRTRTIAYPRQIGMYLTKILTTSSLQQIGKLYGGRDHSTVKHSNDKIKSLYKNNSNVKMTIDQIVNMINHKEIYQ